MTASARPSRAGDPVGATEARAVTTMIKGGTALVIGAATGARAGRGSRRAAQTRLKVQLVVLTTTTFALLAYLVCIVLELLFPESAMWVARVPGFSWTVGGVLLGLVEIGSYAALGSAAYAWLYNLFATWLSSRPRHA